MIAISDCTLRDARNAPGMYFSVPEAVTVAKMLDAIGLNEIEAGYLSGSADDAALLDALAGAGLQTPICSMLLCYSSRAIEQSLDFAVEHGVSRVCLSIPTSEAFIAAKLNRSFRATIKLMQRAVRAAMSRGLSVAFSGEDAARADVERLVEYANAGADAGAARFRFAETVSCLTPNDMSQRVSVLADKVRIPIDVHCHSAWGLGVANTVAAIEAGAKWVSVTVDGIGERGGNTPLAPILLFLHHFKKQGGYRPEHLKPLSDYVAGITNNAAAAFAPITGDHAFQYEFLHQYQQPELYDAFPPGLVGNRRELAFGLKYDRSAYAEVLGVEKIPEHIRELVASGVAKNRRAVSIDDLQTFNKANTSTS